MITDIRSGESLANGQRQGDPCRPTWVVIAVYSIYFCGLFLWRRHFAFPSQTIWSSLTFPDMRYPIIFCKIFIMFGEKYFECCDHVRHIIDSWTSKARQESKLHLSGHECFKTFHITKTFSREVNLGAHWFFFQTKTFKRPSGINTRCLSPLWTEVWPLQRKFLHCESQDTQILTH